MERGPTVGSSLKDVWIQDRLNSTILFYLYFDYIFTLAGLVKNLNKTERTSSTIKADLRILKVVNFFYNLFAHESKHLAVLENWLKHVLAFQFKLEFGSVVC